MPEPPFDDEVVLAHVNRSITQLVGRLEPVLRPPQPWIMNRWTTIYGTPFVLLFWPVPLSRITGWQYNPVGGWAYTTTPRLDELPPADLELRNVARWEQPTEWAHAGGLVLTGTFVRVAYGLLTTTHRRRATDGPARHAG